MPKTKNMNTELREVLERHAFIPIDLNRLEAVSKNQMTEKDRMIWTFLIVRPEHHEFCRGAPRTDHCTQSEFAKLMGIDQSRISRLLTKGILTPGLPWRLWLLQTHAYLEGVAAGIRGQGL